MRNKIYISILLILLLGCKQKSSNFLLDQLPELITNSWEDKSMLETLTNTTLEDAISNHELRQEYFATLQKLFQIDSFETQFIESIKLNNIHGDESTNLLLFAIYHKTVNREDFKLPELIKTVNLLYVKERVLNQDNLEITVNEDCYIKPLSIINRHLIDSLHRINYIDADLVLSASNKECESNSEFLEVYNETLFNYLRLKPNEIIELLEEGNYNKVVLEVICENLRNPINDGIDLEKILERLNMLKETEIRNQIINSIEITVQKYK